MSTCNQLNLETLGSRLIMPKNFPKIVLVKCPSKNKHVTKERGNSCEKVGGLQVQKVSMEQHDNMGWAIGQSITL